MMKIRKKKTKQTLRKKEIKFEKSKILLVILAAALYYIAYLLKFPNSAWLAITIVFLVLLFKNFSKKDGIEAIMYYIILILLVFPITAFLLDAALAYQIFALVINSAIFIFIILGLKKTSRWGFYLSLLIFAISIASAFSGSYSLIGFAFSLSWAIQLLRISVSIVFMISAFIYLIKERRYFR